MKFSNIKKIFKIDKAYVEGIYADTPANRKLGRVGMSYAAYAAKMKQEKEDSSEKIKYNIQFDGDEYEFGDGKPLSRTKLLEEAAKFAEQSAEANSYDEYKFDIQENTEDWKLEDFDKKKYDWLSVKATKHGDKYEISIFDWNKGEYLRNDTQKREEKNFKQQQKRNQEKLSKEFQEKYGWMKEAADLMRQQKEDQYNNEQ